MVHTRIIVFVFLALTILHAATKVVNEDSVWSFINKGASLCCNDHPEFGVCTNNSKCNKWCRQGCSNKRGGFCKRKICHCYCM
ncbi:PREDICTED: putative defensin-like protein 27 [Camelina sativa]|uniref:Defensin-like protein 27 n=1 Tax=Camelina sativa TaxID=90675 RepID=A0ABM1QQS1_CAMSA|nr:PREDICTED: putative defensin-like protein 27 [Camelina sativa]